MASIDLEGISKRYDDGFEAVKALDLHIPDGELLVLVGPSGCGKSTALRMIAGLEEVTAGNVRIDGEIVNHCEPKERDVAMVFQSYALYPHMTVRQNIGFALRLSKLPRPEITRRVDEIARVLDLEEQLDRKPAKLSGGQRQRVAMGRAIVREPKAFLMDEPLSNLDAKLRVQMRYEVARLQSRLRVTTVYVTHDQTEAMTLGDRVAVLNHGVLQQAGRPQELYGHPVNLFVAGFIGSPSMNFFPATVTGDRLDLPFGAVAMPEVLRRRLDDTGGDQAVVAGARPEDFEDAALVDDARRATGLTFDAPVEIVESTGSELFAYFRHDGPDVRSGPLRDLAEADAGAMVAPGRAVARLDPRSSVRQNTSHRLWLDSARLHLFEPETGASLLRAA